MSTLSVGLAIKAIREAKGMTGRELGERSGLQHYDISRIETGKVRLDFGTATRIASTLNISLDMINEQSMKLEEKFAAHNTPLTEVSDAKKRLHEIMKDLRATVPSH